MQELSQITIGDLLLIVGGGVTISDLELVFSSLAQVNPNFRYCSELVEHIRKIGSLPVRNVRSELYHY